MNEERNNLEELDELLGALRDGEITESQMARLDSLLAADPEAMRYYLDFANLCGDLRRYHGAGKMGSGEWAGGEEKIAATPRLFFVKPSGLAIAALLAVVAALVTLLLTREPVRQSAMSEGNGVAVLTRVADAKWEPSSMPAEVGAALPAGKLKLKSGVAQVEFYSGATVVLEGPAEFDLISAQRGFFHRGKVRAHVPPQAIGFTLGTPGMDVVDLGTEFGLSVDRHGTAQVHVFEGKVELHAGAQSKRELTTGQGLEIRSDGGSREIASNAAAFVNPAKLAGLSGDTQQRQRARWLEQSLKIKNDPDVLLYHTFEGQQPWDRTVENHAASRAAPVGAIVGAQWSGGRWPGKSALEFKRTSDRVRIIVPGEYPAMTLATWVRFDGFDRWLSSLMLTDGWKPGAPHWQVSWDGEIILGVATRNAHGVNFYSPKGVLTQADLGRWVHLVTVCDLPSGKVAHYLDGRAIETTPRGIGDEVGAERALTGLTLG